MNKKTIMKFIGIMLIGGIIGGMSAVALLNVKDNAIPDFFEGINQFMTSSGPVLLGLVIALFTVPAVYYYLQAIKTYGAMGQADDEEMDRLEVLVDRQTTLSSTLIAAMMMVAFLVFGIAYEATASNVFLVILVFMVAIVIATYMGAKTVNLVKKHDPRIHGDALDVNFAKEMEMSMDEAERLKLYKAGYRSYQTVKNLTIVFIIITIFSNMLLDTGVYPIILSCGIGFVQVVVFGRESLKLNL